MRTLGSIIAIGILASLSTDVIADGDNVLRGPGSSVKTPIYAGLVLNRGSSLSREIIVVNDPELPARIPSPMGVNTAYDRVNNGGYIYETEFDVEVSEPIVAIEVKFVLFDLWGNHLTTIGMTKIKDLDVGKHRLSANWQVSRGHHAKLYYASIGYVSRIRTVSGEVMKMPEERVLAEISRLSEEFSVGDLQVQSAASR